jgi:hypothetical protein
MELQNGDPDKRVSPYAERGTSMPIGSTDKEIRAKLDEHGAARVKRTMEEGGFSTAWGVNVAKWLAEEE